VLEINVNNPATLGAWSICVTMIGVDFPKSCCIGPDTALASYRILRQLRDSRLRFASVMSCVILNLICNIYGRFCRRRDGRRRFASFVSCGFSMLMHAIYEILCRRRDIGDAWRRFSSVMSFGIPSLIYTLYCVFCRRRTLGVRLPASCPVTSYSRVRYVWYLE
jgi:hypothetical protein